MEPYFQVSFRPNVKLVSTVRKFTEEFYQRMLEDRDVSERVALATHELLENAVAYASDGETGVRVELGVDRVLIRTWNRVTPEQLAQLEQLFAGMSAMSPDEYYRAMLAKTAYRKEGSGLGLARVRAEADMVLRYEVTPDQICIEASTPLTRKGTP